MTHNSNGNGKTELMQNAEAALKAKASMPDPAEDRPKTRTAHEGIISLPNEDQPPSGALEQEGQRPVLERSRKTR